MSINCYSGLQGSGKSYEVVSGPVLDAVMAGRTVVTNIDGISEEKIHEYLVKHRNADQFKLGHIVHVTNERIMSPGFFPDAERQEQPSVVKPGDLCVFDEIWRFWGQGVKLSHEHMQFFRMHRHYVHPVTGLSCDVILITQDISGICRALRNVIEFSFRMHKMKSLGMPTRYRVEMYEGWKQNSKTLVQIFIKKYDKDIFPLYSSYSARVGIECDIDKRQNVFANPRVWIVSAFVLLFFGVSVWGLVAFWNRQKEKYSVEGDIDKPLTVTSPSQITVPSVALPAVPLSSGSDVSDSLRVAGEVVIRGERWILLHDLSSGQIRLENSAAFVGRGLFLVGTVEGRRVATWTGSEKGHSSVSLLGDEK